MTDPASRTYPTTITNVLTTTHSPNPTAPVTIDHITLLDPWPTSPDPESVPFTLTQTALTQRTISFPTAATPSLPVSVTEINSTKVYILWTIQSRRSLQSAYFFFPFPFHIPFQSHPSFPKYHKLTHHTLTKVDMTPYEPPVCPGPNGCSYPAIKPHSECAKLKLQTRCAAQCLLKDWMWWCTKHVSGEADHVGRVCAATGGTEPWGVELLEPCDHTDMSKSISRGVGMREGGREEDCQLIVLLQSLGARFARGMRRRRIRGWGSRGMRGVGRGRGGRKVGILRLDTAGELMAW